mmetsp:Transcript_33940/g.79458  ORF Transcript_33940/g.79458 Transcript_33940/m.79458 type:complete len:266 (+) Transcript_33940:1159-1956(+)
MRVRCRSDGQQRPLLLRLPLWHLADVGLNITAKLLQCCARLAAEREQRSRNLGLRGKLRGSDGLHGGGGGRGEKRRLRTNNRRAIRISRGARCHCDGLRLRNGLVRKRRGHRRRRRSRLLGLPNPLCRWRRGVLRHRRRHGRARLLGCARLRRRLAALLGGSSGRRWGGPLVGLGQLERSEHRAQRRDVSGDFVAHLDAISVGGSEAYQSQQLHGRLVRREHRRDLRVAQPDAPELELRRRGEHVREQLGQELERRRGGAVGGAR